MRRIRVVDPSYRREKIKAKYARRAKRTWGVWRTLCTLLLWGFTAYGGMVAGGKAGDAIGRYFFPQQGIANQAMIELFKAMPILPPRQFPQSEPRVKTQGRINI